MSRELVPELHDIAKLYRIGECLGADLGLAPGILHSGGRLRSLPAALGLPEPPTATWRGIIEHHSRDAPLGPDLMLLVAADHAGSNLAREKEDGEGAEQTAQHLAVHKLWNPRDRRTLSLLDTKKDMQDLLLWLATDPSREDLFRVHGPLLEVRPEQLAPPMNTTSLASHLAVVGSIYRFLSGRRDLYAKATGPKDIEGKPVDLVKGRVSFAQAIVRTRDMTLFDLMGRALAALTRDPRVLVSTFNEVLAILAPDERVEDLFAPLSDAGLQVSWQRARTSVGELKSTASVLRAERLARLKSELVHVPEPHRASTLARRWEQIDREYPRGVLCAELEPRIAGHICDLCQMERATRTWPEDTNASGPRENIGERCYALRQQASRLFRLDRWTEEPGTRVAWILVDLDLDRLVRFLRPLYQKYAQDVGWSAVEVCQIDVRPALLGEFQKDYGRFLSDFASAVEAWIGPDNLERVGGRTEEAGNALLCARLESVGQLSHLLRLYLDGVTRYFPVSLEGATAVSLTREQPFRLAVGVSGVKFPFSEHWRVMQEEREDVMIHVVGRGRVHAPLASVPLLIDASQPSRRTALHNLAQVAKVSEALAEVYLQGKGDRHSQEYHSLLAAMRPLGMTYESLLAYAKILEE